MGINVSLKEEVVMFIGILVIIAILLGVVSKDGQQHRFMRDCTELNSPEFCEKLWKMTNARGNTIVALRCQQHNASSCFSN